MNEPALALRTVGLTKSFRGLEVLRGVDLAVTLGTTHAVIGPNGAGKTTLFNILSGAILPSDGRVELRGRDVTGWAPHQLLKLGLARSTRTDTTERGLYAIADWADLARSPE